MRIFISSYMNKFMEIIEVISFPKLFISKSNFFFL